MEKCHVSHVVTVALKEKSLVDHAMYLHLALHPSTTNIPLHKHYQAVAAVAAVAHPADHHKYAPPATELAKSLTEMSRIMV